MFELSNHAREQMNERGLTEEVVLSVIRNPQQVVSVEFGKEIYQSVVKFEDSDRPYIVRVVINTLKDPILVITAYKSSKIEKYWRDEGEI